MPAERDPVSVLFDGAARRLLARAYARPGEWVMTRLADPAPRHVAWAAERGISSLTGPDRSSARGGAGLNARTRWCRAYVRALYFQHRWFSGGGHDGKGWRGERRMTPRNAGALRIEVGRHLAATPQFDPRDPGAGGFPPGRAVRVQLARGGQSARRVVTALPDSRRIYDDQGVPAARWSDIGKRDW